jgi:hypothetical protein
MAQQQSHSSRGQEPARMAEAVRTAMRELAEKRLLEQRVSGRKIDRFRRSAAREASSVAQPSYGRDEARPRAARVGAPRRRPRSA